MGIRIRRVIFTVVASESEMLTRLHLRSVVHRLIFEFIIAGSAAEARNFPLHTAHLYLRHRGSVEQFVRILVGMGCGKCGAAEVNRLPVAPDYGVDWRSPPSPQTFEAEPIAVIGDRAGNVSVMN